MNPKSHVFWIYRSRLDSESIDDAESRGQSEYDQMRKQLRKSWPILRFRLSPAEGVGIKVFITVFAPHDTVTRFVARCVAERNAVEPTARLSFERILNSR